MNELKAYNVVVTDECVDYICGQNQLEFEAYAAEDVDAAIAELKAQKAQAEDDCAYWKTMAQKNADDNSVMANQRVKAFKQLTELKEDAKNLILDNYLNDKEIRHHKYKRCLAMADKCVDLCHKAKNLYRWAEDENLEHHYNHKIEFFARWHQRWLTLAEKFKEAK